MVEDRCVIDDGAHAERHARVCLGAEFPAKPADGIRLELLIAFFKPAAICGDDIGEVKTVDELREVLELLADDRLGGHAGSLGFRFGRSDELLHDAAERSAVWLGAGGDVAHQLRVQRPGLAATGVQSAVRVQVRAGHHQLLF